MRYTDENEEAAWEVYNESLFLTPKTDTTDTQPEGETKEGEVPAERDMEELVPKFGAKWNNKQMLEAVSGIEKPDPEPEPQVKPEPKEKQDAEDGKKSKARPRGSAAPAAARRGGRAKASSKATVTID